MCFAVNRVQPVPGARRSVAQPVRRLGVHQVHPKLPVGRGVDIHGHADPVAGLRAYDPVEAILPVYEAADFNILNTPSEIDAIAAAVTTEPVMLNDAQVADITAFLHALTDEVAVTGRMGSWILWSHSLRVLRWVLNHHG